MKMHHALAAVLIGFGAQAAFAWSEGGDTWSSVQPKRYSGSAPSMTVATTGKLDSLRNDYTSGEGTPAMADSSNRVVELYPSVRWVDVAYGERVTFKVDQGGVERSFAWKFNVSPVRTHVDLEDVASADFPVRGVRVFATESTDYSGG